MVARRLVLQSLAAIGLVIGGGSRSVRAQSGTPVGRVTRLRGTALHVRGGTPAALAVGVEVFVADRIVTNPASRVEVALADGTLIVLGPSTDVAVAAFALGQDGRRAGGALSMISGILRSVVAPSGGTGGFAIEGRLAVASVRSTEVIVEVVEDRMSVFAAEGEVAVRAGSEEVTLLSGDGVNVRPGEPLPEPSQWGAARVADVLARTQIE